MKHKLLVFTTLCISATLFGQSPWPRNKGGVYSQLAYHFIPKYEKLFDGEGEELALPGKISEATIQAYGEYGIAKRTTAIVSLPFRMIELSETGAASNIQAGKLSGLGNVTLGIRQGIYNKDFQVAATLKADLPASKKLENSGIRLGYDAATITGLLSAGMGFKNAYAFAYAGYGHRTNDFSSVFNGGIEGGYHLKKLWLIAFTETVWALGDEKTAQPTAFDLTKLYVDRQQYVSIGFKGIFEFNRFAGAFVSAAGVADARNLPRSPGIGFGAYFKWE